jgi:hypothetical protein
MARPWRDIGRYGSVGIEFLLTILIVSWLGHWLDGRVSLHGYGLGVGFLLGVAVAFRNLVRTAQGMQRDIERAEARDPHASRWTVDPNWVHKDPGETGSSSNSPPDPRPPGDRPPPADHDDDR